MVIYKLQYVRLDVCNNQFHTLGYYSSIEFTKLAISKFSRMSGFKENSKSYEILTFNIEGNITQNTVFEVSIYYHDVNYDIEYSQILGVCTKKDKARLKLNNYQKLNRNIILSNEIIYESFIDEFTLNDFEYCEGF